MASAAQDAKAEDVAILDLRDLSSSFDYFLICSVSSSRRMNTVAEDIREAVKPLGIKVTHLEGDPEGGWLLIDGGSVIAHLFTSEVRAFYNLERLWGDAPRIPVPVPARRKRRVIPACLPVGRRKRESALKSDPPVKPEDDIVK